MGKLNNGLQYTDSDVAKVADTEAPAETPTPAEDDMFEDLFVQGGQQEAAPAEEAPATPEEGNVTEQEAPAESEAPAEEGTDDEGINVDDVDTSGLSPEVLAILDNIEYSDGVQENAFSSVNQIAEQTGNAELQQSVTDLQTAIQERDRQIEQFIKQIANERAESDRLLDENMLANVNNRESQKYMEVLEDNPLMKDILVLAMNKDNEQAQARLKDLTRQLYEETNGVNVDDMMEDRKRNEKLGMGDGAYDTTGIAPSGGNDLGGMLEDIS